MSAPGLSTFCIHHSTFTPAPTQSAPICGFTPHAHQCPKTFGGFWRSKTAIGGNLRPLTFFQICTLRIGLATSANTIDSTNNAMSQCTSNPKIGVLRVG